MKNPIILAIDTSLDETSVAITEGRRVLTNVVFSQIKYHQQYRGVMPALAKRLHQEKLPLVLKKALSNVRLKEKEIDIFAVTQGPGQAIALEVGILAAKKLAADHQKPLVGVNHLVGHIYSAFCQNRSGLPNRKFQFPYLCLIVSGGHTQLVLFDHHLDFRLLGETLDDAAGEALDKAARMLGFGYPGGPVIERLAAIGDPQRFVLPVPLIHKAGLDFSYSGLKTALLYKVKKMGILSKTEIQDLAAAFQQSLIDSLLFKVKRALKSYPEVKTVLVIGGVASNQALRRRMRSVFKLYRVLFPSWPSVVTDNAAMIGVAAYYYFLAHKTTDLSHLDRQPNLSF
jgi:N6-L-threonylcarbamoyladenine synthase